MSGYMQAQRVKMDTCQHKAVADLHSKILDACSSLSSNFFIFMQFLGKFDWCPHQGWHPSPSLKCKYLHFVVVWCIKLSSTIESSLNRNSTFQVLRYYVRSVVDPGFPRGCTKLLFGIILVENCIK